VICTSSIAWATSAFLLRWSINYKIAHLVFADSCAPVLQNLFITCLCLYRLAHTQVPQKLYYCSPLSVWTCAHQSTKFITQGAQKYYYYCSSLSLRTCTHTIPTKNIARICLYRLVHTTPTNFYFYLLLAFVFTDLRTHKSVMDI